MGSWGVDPSTGSGGGGGKTPPWLNPLIAGTSIIGAGFPTVGSSNGTATSQSTSQNQGWQNVYQGSDINSLLQTLNNLTSRTNQATTGSVTPTQSPEAARFMNQLIGQYSNLARSAPNLAPYAAQQTQNINRNSNLQSEAVRNAMAARGLATSPASGTAEANIQAGRVAQISQMLSQIPLLRNQLQLQNLGAAGSFYSAIPRGQVTSGTQTGESSQTSDTSQTGKTTSVNTSDTNYGGQSTNQGTTIQNSNTSQGGGLGGILQAIGPILAALFL